ncbi:MAG: hydroxyethylthiazole kinase [Legionellales bacterium]|nr:hydroxyethylthiazole kinase [Legionellales bacterium]
MIDALKQTLSQLRKTKPLVLCLTNHVTMDLMANALLCLGAAPIMSEDARELEELVNICHVIYLNIGTLDKPFIERASLAAELAQKYHKPLILDPVGAGASKIRTETSRTLVPYTDIIRGNASEIMAITDTVHATLGVEAAHCVSDAAGSAVLLSQTNACTVVISGAEDFVTNGREETHIPFGSSLMPLVTGMGCTLTAVISAFLAIVPDAFLAATQATTYFGMCGQLAALKTKNPGTFRALFLDELYLCDLDAMKSLSHVA